MTRRRVVTGHDENGKAVFGSDDNVDELTAALLPGNGFLRVWAGTANPDLREDESASFSGGAFPLPGESGFGFVTMTPTGSAEIAADLDLATAIDEVNE